MKGLIFSLLLFVSLQSNAQITVDQAGNDWKSIVDSALQKIQSCDSLTYQFILKNVAHIEMWNGSFSTTEIDNNNKWAVVISARDFEFHSINNIACVIVHEGFHVSRYLVGNLTCDDHEEVLAYEFEQEFQKKLKDAEPWLTLSTTYHLNFYKDRLKKHECK